MDKKKLMLLLGAFVIAVGTALAARSLLGSGPAPQTQAMAVPTGPRVLVAQRALPVGTIITPDAVNFQAWPKDLIQDAYFVDGAFSKDKLLGTVVRFPITAGQPLTQGALVSPRDRGFLAAALTSGMRAVTVPVSDMTGVGGFVFPGDHVDIMLTQKVKGPMDNDDTALKATETVLRNIRVLATDQSTETEIVNGKTVVHRTGTVTLEVTPRIAEKVQVAQSIGTLSLALRSLADNQSDLDHAVANGTAGFASADGKGIGKGAGMGKGAPNIPGKPGEDKLLAMSVNKPYDGVTTFQTGGDLSRFQRKDLPMKYEKAPSASAGSSAMDAYRKMMGGALSALRQRLGGGAAAAPSTVNVVRGNAVSVTNTNESGSNPSGLANGVGQAGRTTAAVLPAAGAE